MAEHCIVHFLTVLKSVEKKSPFLKEIAVVIYDNKGDAGLNSFNGEHELCSDPKIAFLLQLHNITENLILFLWFWKKDFVKIFCTFFWTESTFSLVVHILWVHFDKMSMYFFPCLVISAIFMHTVGYANSAFKVLTNGMSTYFYWIVVRFYFLCSNKIECELSPRPRDKQFSRLRNLTR